MSIKISCLIVDDEPIAREIVQNYCNHFPGIKVEGSCGNALEAKALIQSKNIDLIFLDINMPVLDGMAFLKTLRRKPQVIFTTAYREYAVDAYDLDAVDYLLKPFSLERFIVAVDKVIEKIQTTAKGESFKESSTNEFVFIRADGKIYKLFHHDLLYAEASGNYTKIVTGGRPLLVNMSFSSFEELLPSSVYVRIHRSFLVNKSKITHVEGNRVYVSEAELPVGSNYKAGFMKELGFD